MLDTDNEMFTLGGPQLNMMDQVLAMISGFFFAVAYFAWQVLLGLMKMALSSETILTAAAGPINYAVAWLGSNILVLSVVFWAIALLRMFKDLISLHWIKLLRTLIVFTVMFASLLFVTNASLAANAERAAAPPGAAQPSPLSQTGTMPWMAATALGLVNTIVSPLTTPILGDGKYVPPNGKSDGDWGAGAGSAQEANLANVAAPAGSQKYGDPLDQGLAPTCENYIDVLESGYMTGPEANRAVVVVNRFWLQTYYQSWQTAAFGLPTGNENLPGRAMCHWAEATSRIPADSQQAVMQTAYPGIAIADGAAVYGPDFESADVRRVAMTAWAACDWNRDGNNAWTMNEVYSGVSPTDGNALDDTKCQEVFQQTDGGPLANTASPGASLWVYGNDIASNTEKMTDDVNKEAVVGFARAMSGYDGIQRVLQGIIALVIAVLFLYSVGAIAVGLVFTQFLAVLCLMFALPAAFVLYAIGRDRVAARMLKVTASAVLSQVLFSLLLTALILVTGTVSALVAFVDLPGILSPVLYGASPLIAYFLIRKLLKTFGMGDIISGAGALSFATTAALTATGDKQIERFARGHKGSTGGVERALSKTPFLGRGVSKADRLTRNALPRTWKAVDPRVSARMRREDERHTRAEAKRSKEESKERQRQRRDEFLQREIDRRSGPNASGVTGPLAGTRDAWKSALSKIDATLKSDSPERQRARNLAEMTLKLGVDASVGAASLLNGIPGAAMLGALAAAIPNWARSRGVDPGSLVSNARSYDMFRDMRPDADPASSWQVSTRTISAEDIDELPEIGYLNPTRSVTQEDADDLRERTIAAVASANSGGFADAGDATGLSSYPNWAASFIADAQERNLGTRDRVLGHDEQRALQLSAGTHFGYDPEEASQRVIVSADGVARIAPLSGAQASQMVGRELAREMQRFENWIPQSTLDLLGPMDPGELAVTLQYLGSKVGVTDGDLGKLFSNKPDLLDAVAQSAFKDFKLNGDPTNASRVFGDVVQRILEAVSVEQITSEDLKAIAALRTVTAAGTAANQRVALEEQQAAVSQAKVVAAEAPADKERAVTSVSEVREAAAMVDAQRSAVRAAEASGNPEAVTLAAERFSQAIDRFEQVTSATMEQLALTMVRQAEMGAAGAGLSAGDGEEFLRRYAEHLAKMDQTTDQFAEATDSFRNGTASLKEASERLEDVADTIERSYETNREALFKGIDEVQRRLASASVRNTANKPVLVTTEQLVSTLRSPALPE